jgi:hypothetical protein
MPIAAFLAGLGMVFVYGHQALKLQYLNQKESGLRL